MFIQVIKGRTSDPDGLRRAAEAWGDKGREGAIGWLGTTAGVTEDGRVIVVVRFEDEEKARQNSDRPETGEWAREMSSHLDGEPEYVDCTWAYEFAGGGSDDAGFVQVMEGHTSDPETAKRIAPMMDEVPSSRPDVIGGTMAMDDSGHFFQTVYFTSEAEARKGEASSEGTDDLPQEANDWWETVQGGITWYDLKSPQLQSR